MSGEINYKKLTEKKKILDEHRPFDAALVKNLEEWFRIELTYTSNAIEGNTLSRAETALVVEKGLTIGGKSITEHLEATNHAAALDFVKEQIKRKPSDLRERDILKIHEIILDRIDRENAGQGKLYYRRVPVRISGSAVVMPNPRKVQTLMDEFFSWLENETKMHAVELAAEAHYRFVTIHPFTDGNGRTARLLMNMILMMRGYPPAIIRKNDRLNYIKSLEKAQLVNGEDDSKKDYFKLIAAAVDRSLNIYLKAIDGEVEKVDSEKLLKIGELAKATNQTVPTIRHWTKEGLLQVAEVTESGYQMYSEEMIERVREIQEMKERRLTLEEIKENLK